MSPGWMMRSEKVWECGVPRGPATELTHSTRSDPRRKSLCSHLQALDLVRRLDLTCIQHRLLSVDDLDAFLLESAQHGELCDVDAQRLLLETEARERLLDLLGKPFLDAGLGWKRPLQEADRCFDAVGDPRRAEPLRRRSRIPQERVTVARAESVAVELVPGPLPNVGARDISHVVDLEAQDGSEPGRLHGLLSTHGPIPNHLLIVDGELPVLRHRSPLRSRVRPVVFHSFLLNVSAASG
jgi:hypothetical protein